MSLTPGIVYVRPHPRMGWIAWKWLSSRKVFLWADHGTMKCEFSEWLLAEATTNKKYLMLDLVQNLETRMPPALIHQEAYDEWKFYRRQTHG